MSIGRSDERSCSVPTSPIGSIGLWADEVTVVVDRFDRWVASLGALEDMLSRDERESVRRLWRLEHRQRYIITHAVRRLVLARVLGDRVPANLELRRSAYGKPFLLPRPGAVDVRFNVSDDEIHFALALTVGREVGIDIMDASFTMSEDALDLCMTEDERAVFATLAPPSRPAFARRLWVRKEALVKAEGKGLSIPLTELDVRPHISGPIAVPAFVVEDLPEAAGYAGAVAIATHATL